MSHPVVGNLSGVSSVCSFMSTYQRHALVSAAILAVVLVTSCDAQTAPERAEPAPTSIPSTSTTSAAPSSPSSPSEPAPPAGARADLALDGLPLWPFSGYEQVRQWQAAPDAAPWHRDAQATAVAFTTDYLGFTGLDTVVASDIGESEAKVTIGYQLESSRPATSAVVHLVRWGEGPDAPWEVVGTIDDSLTLTEPGYGSTISSPVTVGGRITGVDEGIHVRVLDPTAPAPVGDVCCLSAGGENTPWSRPVSITGASNATLTIVAATGGHAVDVERFAVTGVRLAG